VVTIVQLLQSDWCHLHSGSATLLCIKIPQTLIFRGGRRETTTFIVLLYLLGQDLFRFLWLWVNTSYRLYLLCTPSSA